MARRTLLLIASILMAALGTALIWLYIQGERGRIQADMVPALFFTRPLEAGSTVSPADVVQRQVPEDVAAGTVTDLSQITNRTLSVRAFPQQILVQSMFGGTAGARFSNEGAMALTITDPHRVPADLRAGDIVDVFGIKQGDPPRPVVRGIKVRSVGPAPASVTAAAPGTATAGSTAVPVTIVGFDANGEQAVDLYEIETLGEQPALYIRNPPEK